MRPHTPQGPNLTSVIAAMTSGVLAEPPYNFSAASVGLTFVGPLLASIPGSILGGRLADAYAVRRARANGGVSEAEHKLHLFAVPLVGMVVGLLMMGLGPAYEAHWIVFVLGTSIVNFMGPIATLLALAYAFDCFHSIRPENQDGPQAATQDAAPYLLTVILVGMTIAFGFVRFADHHGQTVADGRVTRSRRGASNGASATSGSRPGSHPFSSTPPPISSSGGVGRSVAAGRRITEKWSIGSDVCLHLQSVAFISSSASRLGLSEIVICMLQRTPYLYGTGYRPRSLNLAIGSRRFFVSETI